MEIIDNTLNVPFNGRTLVEDIEMYHPTYLKNIAVSFGKKVIDEILNFLQIDYDNVEIKIS